MSSYIVVIQGRHVVPFLNEKAWVQWFESQRTVQDLTGALCDCDSRHLVVDLTSNADLYVYVYADGPLPVIYVATATPLYNLLSWLCYETNYSTDAVQAICKIQELQNRPHRASGNNTLAFASIANLH